MAKAKLDEAKAEVALARLHLSFTEIRAPFAGTIDRIPFKLGSLIDEGQLLPAFQITGRCLPISMCQNPNTSIIKPMRKIEASNKCLLLANNSRSNKGRR